MLTPSPEASKCEYSYYSALLRWLRYKMNVPPDAISEPEMLSVGRVVFLDNFAFELSEDAHGGQAVMAALFVARDECGDPVDTVAWTPKLNRVASLRGRVALLGEEQVFGPRFDDQQALMVHETPLAWLLAERQGVVIVNPRRAAPILRAAEPLKASSAAFALRLRNLINPKPPRIFFAPSAEMRAVS